jgi:hypothetical protein
MTTKLTVITSLNVAVAFAASDAGYSLLTERP